MVTGRRKGADRRVSAGARLAVNSLLWTAGAPRRSAIYLERGAYRPRALGAVKEDLMNLFRSRPKDDEVEPGQARTLQEGGATLVDVREPAEWRSGHAGGAVHIPLGSLPGRLDELPAGPLLFICRSGGRSNVATALARAKGLDAKNVRGGTLAWTKAGLPVEKG